MSKAEQKANFKAITGNQNDAEVEQYLEACGWDIATAVDLFFARAAEDEPRARRQTGRQQPQMSRSRASQNSARSARSDPDVMMLSEDDDEWGEEVDDEIRIAEDDDEPTSSRAVPTRTLRPRRGASYRPNDPAPVENKRSRRDDGSSKAAVSDSGQDDEVRAPMTFRHGPIVSHSLEQQYTGGSSLFPRHRQPEMAATRGVFEGVRDHKALAAEQARALRNTIEACSSREGGGGVSSSTSATSSSSSSSSNTTASSNGRSNGRGPPQGEASIPNGNMPPSRSLQALFRPPVDLIFQGDWESTKAEAVARGLWILVNVQNVTEFACQTLNRDVWSNGGVKELVRGYFVFWQVYHDSVDGQRMNSYYGVRSYPSIFVVDPRTGECVYKVSLKSQDPVSLCDALTRFVDDFPDFATRDRFMVGGAAPDEHAMLPAPGEAQGTSNGDSAVSRKRRQEQHHNTNGGMKNGDEEQGENGEAEGKKPKIDVDEMEECTRGLSMVDEDEWRKHLDAGGEQVRVMLRFPDGGRHNIELTSETKLLALLLYIRGRGLVAEDHVFILSFPKREYSVDQSDSTLAELGFSRSEMVHVELK